MSSSECGWKTLKLEEVLCKWQHARWALVTDFPLEISERIVIHQHDSLFLHHRSEPWVKAIPFQHHSCYMFRKNIFVTLHCTKIWKGDYVVSYFLPASYTGAWLKYYSKSRRAQTKASSTQEETTVRPTVSSSEFPTEFPGGPWAQSQESEDPMRIYNLGISYQC